MNEINILYLDDANFNYDDYIYKLRELIQIRNVITEVELWIKCVTSIFDSKYIEKDMIPLRNAIIDINTKFKSMRSIIEYNRSVDNTGLLQQQQMKIIQNIILKK